MAPDARQAIPTTEASAGIPASQTEGCCAKARPDQLITTATAISKKRAFMDFPPLGAALPTPVYRKCRRR